MFRVINLLLVLTAIAAVGYTHAMELDGADAAEVVFIALIVVVSLRGSEAATLVNVEDR